MGCAMSGPEPCDGCMTIGAGMCVCPVVSVDPAALTPTQRAILPLLTNRLDRDEQAGLTPLALADVERPGRTWTLAPWECDRCGDLYDAQTDRQGRMYDGDLLVCVSCGAVARVSADEDGAHAADPHGALTEAAHADLYAREFAGAYFDGHDPGDEHDGGTP